MDQVHLYSFVILHSVASRSPTIIRSTINRRNLKMKSYNKSNSNAAIDQEQYRRTNLHRINHYIRNG